MKTRSLIAEIMRTLIGLAVLAVGALLVARAFPLETAIVRSAVVLERRGCGWTDAILAIPYTAGHRKRVRRLELESHELRREVDGTVLWSTPAGEHWAPSEENGAFFEVAELERLPYSDGDVRVKPGDVAIDCGAHIGLFTRQALDAGARLVVSVEPGRKQIACLKRNFAREIAAGRVIVCEKGVWNRAGSLQFDDNSTAVASFATATGGSHTRAVPVTTIDALVTEYKLERVDFIKMDIEGSEQQALAGAAETLARFRPGLAIASYHRSDDPERIPVLVRSAYPPYQIRSAGCRLDLSQIRPLTIFAAAANPGSPRP
jgi:FkbM family methyltransferase